MKRRVLLVDDNEELTFHLGRYLERRGCEVERVNEAPKALAVARAFQPDAIILDYFMPELNGADLAWQLEADEALRRVPVMICSGYAEKISPRELPPKAFRSAPNRFRRHRSWHGYKRLRERRPANLRHSSCTSAIAASRSLTRKSLSSSSALAPPA
jgi:CheY-like chemotaxis protein